MSDSEENAVLSCVAAICSAYADGRAQLREIRKHRIAIGTLRESDDLRLESLASILHKSNTVVRNQYDHSLVQMGASFAQGDSQAGIELKSILINLQHQVLDNLKVSLQHDLPIDFRVLQDAANQSRDKVVLSLLTLHSRIITSGWLGNLSPNVPQRAIWETPGYKELQPRQRPREDVVSRDGSESRQSPSTKYSPLNMPRLTTVPNMFPPPPTTLPTPPPSADASRRSTVSSDGGKTRPNEVRPPLPTRQPSNEQNNTTREAVAMPESFREPLHTSPPLNLPPLKPPPPLMKPVRPGSPVLRPNSRTGSLATNATNEQDELVENPWDEPTLPVKQRDNKFSPISPPARYLFHGGPNNSQRAMAHTTAPLESSASSVYSATRSNVSYNVPGSDQREFLPSEKNKYQGLCKSAWRLQTGQRKKAMKTRARMVAAHGNKTVSVWSCSSCEFEGKLVKLGKESVLDTTIYEVSVNHADGQTYAVRWRWTFLFRSHFPFKMGSGWDAHTTVQQRTNFGCVFCCALGKIMKNYTGVKALIDHIALEHVGRARWPTDEVLYRLNCVIGERAPEDADWDINLAEV